MKTIPVTINNQVRLLDAQMVEKFMKGEMVLSTSEDKPLCILFLKHLFPDDVEPFCQWDIYGAYGGKSKSWFSRSTSHLPAFPISSFFVPDEQPSATATTSEPYRRELTEGEKNLVIKAANSFTENDNQDWFIYYHSYCDALASLPPLEYIQQMEVDIGKAEQLKKLVKDLLLFVEDNGHVINGFRTLEIVQQIKTITNPY